MTGKRREGEAPEPARRGVEPRHAHCAPVEMTGRGCHSASPAGWDGSRVPRYGPFDRLRAGPSGLLGMRKKPLTPSSPRRGRIEGRPRYRLGAPLSSAGAIVAT